MTPLDAPPSSEVGVPPELADARERFVGTWGQMAGAWGISRTMAEIHALLYVTGDALCTDDVMAALRISRGNASMSLRALLDWGIVSKTHRKGDRKEYFAAEQDIWAMFRAIVSQRLKREVDPMIASLHELRDLTGERAPGVQDDPAVAAHNKRLEDLVEFFETIEMLAGRFVSPQGEGLQSAALRLAEDE
ncbi:MAG: ArsR family transcriptional regulator [Planctomycetota bacterium]